MKYLLSLLGGVILGSVLAGAALYFNPLANGQAERLSPEGWPLNYSLSTPPLALTHNRQLKLPTYPNGVPLLWENGIRGSLLSVLALADDSGAVDAVATRISVPSTETNPLTSGVLVDDFWLVTSPGRGTLYVSTTSNQWPLLKDTRLRVDFLQQVWAGPSAYEPVLGPRGDSGEVHGLSGEFAGTIGSAHERVEVRQYGSSGFQQVDGRMLLALRDREP